MDKAERMERTARLCFYAGMVTLGVSLYLLAPIAGTRVREVLGAFLEAYCNGPLQIGCF
jgi:hypothetical protein